jgi:hypothetical protein
MHHGFGALKRHISAAKPFNQIDGKIDIGITRTGTEQVAFIGDQLIRSQGYLDGEWIAIDATLDIATYQKLFVPHDVAWGIDWNGREDMRLYTENIAGPVDFFEDIDAAIRQNVGISMPLPSPSEAEAFFGPANQQMWQAVAA